MKTIIFWTDKNTGEYGYGYALTDKAEDWVDLLNAKTPGIEHTAVDRPTLIQRLASLGVPPQEVDAISDDFFPSEGKTIELCEEFSCPLRIPGARGCDYYTPASLCHLVRSEFGIREGVETLDYTPFSRHCVRVRKGTDLTPFREAQEAFLSRPEIQRRIRDDQKFLDEYLGFTGE